ncbi:hypothetical protein BOTBODRAFT_485037 [Botryobasidium botryosum FD-172 SS1]|uniref:DNA mismatch repair protein MSH3 n=1 Tax=Botryobasidium botryosum (strain FD-172 SS1) TaxID=930990 RepID=A0A067N5S9_BOTB1|nr:hypothetical protein BOTBODRAFT_485037 [Botryobasidium botryosum FD-172 SS1]
MQWGISYKYCTATRAGILILLLLLGASSQLLSSGHRLSARVFSRTRSSPLIEQLRLATEMPSHSTQCNYPSRPTTGRPHTARPPSARPTTAASNMHTRGSYIAAVLEGRGVAREVGIAAFDKDTGKVVVLQLQDCQTYVKTLHHLQLHSPHTILLPDTFLPTGHAASRQATPLVQCLQEEFPDVGYEAVGRKFWNENTGLEFITQLIIEDEDRSGTLMNVSNKYYCLSATAAMFKYAQLKLNMVFSPHSLRIAYTGVDGMFHSLWILPDDMQPQFAGTMLIDTESAKNLELVQNSSNKKSTHSLFGLLNHTFTPMASRLLRVNILAPITVQSSIEARLDAVEELVQDENRYSSVRDALRALKGIDIDKLISSLALSETRPKSTPQSASSRVSHMLRLRNVVRSLPAVQAAVNGCRCPLLQAISSMLSDDRIAKIEERIGQSLNEDVTNSTGGGLQAVNIKVYAVKANFQRLLDVAREAYKENVGDIFTLCETLSEEHDLPLALEYEEKGGGFWLTVKKDRVEGSLPQDFINVSSKKAKWIFTTMELKKRNLRMQDSLSETLMLSDKIIQGLVEEVLQDIGVLYKASEAVSLLDMLWAFSHAAILKNYVRPEFTGTLAIKGGRHPVSESILSAGTYVPADTYACSDASFQIITGPNMAGKTTYLKHVGVLAVMAMCGSFVSAEYASFRIHDALLTRLSNDADPEKNLSTFANEMASSAMILDRSLVIIDELGRGTSPVEGTGIAFAIAEELINIGAFVFFATHFLDLCTLLGNRPRVVSLHLAVQNNVQPNSSNFGMVFKYRVAEGPTTDTPHYGLELAKIADLPQDVLDEANRVSAYLSDLEAKNREASKSTKAALRRKAMLRLHTQLTQVAEHSTLPEKELAEYLHKLQVEMVSVLGSVLDEDPSIDMVE